MPEIGAPNPEWRRRWIEKERRDPEFTARTLHFGKQPQEFLAIEDVFGLSAEEISPQLSRVVQLINESAKEGVFGPRHLAWRLQAYLEFQDLMDFAVLRKDRDDPVAHRHFCYLESVRILEELTKAGLAGNFHASLSLTRSFLEYAMAELFFRAMSDRDDGWIRFREWFVRKRGPTDFAQMLDTLFGSAGLERFKHLRVRLEGAYHLSSTYVHRPTPSHSFTVYRRSNSMEPSLEAVFYWSISLSLILQSVLFIYCCAIPNSLFPIDSTRKFGFNPPVGVFADQSNAWILERALGEKDVAEIRSDIKRKPSLVGLVEEQTNRSDRAPGELDAEWAALPDKARTSEPPGSTTEDPFVWDRRRAEVKSTMRAYLWATTAVEAEKENPEVTEPLPDSDKVASYGSAKRRHTNAKRPDDKGDRIP